MGVLAAMVARMVGARVVALEPDAARRRMATEAGGHLVLDPGDSSSDDGVSRVFGELGPDVIVETSQAWSGLTRAVRLARQETRIAIVGIYRIDPSADVGRDLLRATFMNRDRFHNQHLRFIGCSNDPADDYPVGLLDGRSSATCNTSPTRSRRGCSYQREQLLIGFAGSTRRGV